MDNFDLEIKKMRLEYDISAIGTQLIDEKRKLLETRKSMANIQDKINELQGKVQEKRNELDSL
jgi:septal ring factor EnvC (AmiA/AmiB activator)